MESQEGGGFALKWIRKVGLEEMVRQIDNMIVIKYASSFYTVLWLFL
jgi:hypothetical protein